MKPISNILSVIQAHLTFMPPSASCTEDRPIYFEVAAQLKHLGTWYNISFAHITSCDWENNFTWPIKNQDKIEYQRMCVVSAQVNVDRLITKIVERCVFVIYCEKKMIMWYGCVVDSTNWVDIWQIWKKQLKQKSNINFKEKHSKLHLQSRWIIKSCLRSEVLLSILSEKARMYVPSAQCPVPSAQ